MKEEPPHSDADTADPLVEQSAIKPERNAPVWIKFFVVWHLIAITAWTLPRLSSSDSGPKPDLTGPDWVISQDDHWLRSLSILQAYLGVSGLWQYWDMFAPDPANADWYGDAWVTYRDGHRERYQYPRMVLLPIPLKFTKERYRKFFERAHDDTKDCVFRPFAQRIAFLMDHKPDDPPVKVDLYRHWRLTAPPGGVQTQDYQEYCYFQYAVDEGLLRKERAGIP